MHTQKVAITIPKELVAMVDDISAGGQTLIISFSFFINLFNHR